MRIEPRTLADLIRNNTRCPLHGVGHGRGSRGPRYSWGEVQALKAWLEGGRC